MKIAVVTDDGQALSAHFGRSRHYLVLTIEDGQIVDRTLRDKPARDNHAHAHGEHPHEHDLEHAHAHRGQHDPRGHGFGRGADRRHAELTAPIEDCDVLLARGMGQGAYLALQRAGITPITTDIKPIEDAVQAYLSGADIDRPERRH